MILEVCWDGLWSLSFGLSQFHGHGSWLVCEVVLAQLPWGPTAPVTLNMIFSVTNSNGLAQY